MVTQDFERVCRRLREHHRKVHAACGTRAAGLTVIVFEWFDECDGCRWTCCRVEAPHTAMLGQAREIAAAVLGKAQVAAGREFQVDMRTMVFATPLDAVGLQRFGSVGGLNLTLSERAAASRIDSTPATRPAWVRWFDAGILAAGVGQGGAGGHLIGPGRRLVRCD